MYRSAHALCNITYRRPQKLSHACLFSRNVKIYRPHFEITVVMATRAIEIADLNCDK
jgi:hypothetical protein